MQKRSATVKEGGLLGNCSDLMESHGRVWSRPGTLWLVIPRTADNRVDYQLSQQSAGYDNTEIGDR